MSFFAPNIAYASASLNTFLTNVNAQIINPLISLLFAVAIAFFLWGVFEFIANQQNDEKRTTGKMHMLWGVIGITIMLGVFTILNMIISTFDIQGIDPEQGTVQ